MKMRNMTIISIMHRKYLTLQQYHYNYNTVTIITVIWRAVCVKIIAYFYGSGTGCV